MDRILNEEAIKSLREVLKEFNAEKVEIFTNQLEEICQDMKGLSGYSKPRELKLQFLEEFQSLKKTLRFLERIERNEPWVPFPRKIWGLDTDEGRNMISLILNAEIKAMEALTPIKDVVEQVKKIEKILPQIETKQSGRPRADETEFITAIALYYKLILNERPSNYKDGPFYGIVRIVLDAMGFPRKTDPTNDRDPSKTVAAALKNLEILLKVPAPENG